MTDQIQEAKDWLGDLSKIVSRQKTKEDYEYAKSRTDALDWLINRVEDLEKGNERYRRALEEIRNEASSYMGNSAAQRLYNIADKALKGESQ